MHALLNVFDLLTCVRATIATIAPISIDVYTF